jgi:2,5-diketo-D-gluconate reductase A
MIDTDIPTAALNDGRAIPRLGLGVWQIPNEETAAAVRTAIDAGYRSVDTAAIYHNEVGVGEAVRAAPVPRDALFVTTKVWNERQGHDETLRAFDESLARLGLDYVDLYLVHWPAPRRNRYVETWRALARLREEGRARSIGVSNFTVAHLRRVIDETGVVPAVNQIELHPRFQQGALRAFHAERGIVTESWSPLAQGKLVGDPTIDTIARKHGKTTAQVIIRWHLDLGLVVIPKSARPARMRENLDVLDFRLDDEDMARIAALDRPDGRLGFDPDTFS